MKKIILAFACSLTVLFLPAQNAQVIFRSKMTFPGQSVANVWGYSADGREYALIGASKGLIIADITNPDAPQQIVQIPGPNSLWKEIKTFQQFAYIVSEGGQGVQIVDLRNLPAPDLSYHHYTGDGPIEGLLGKIHALHIDTTKGFLYAYGGDLFNGGAKVLNLLADPYNPTYAGKFDQMGYIHDGYVDNDTLFGAHIYTGQFSVVNMADKNNPQVLATQNTPNNFTHNTWLSADRKILFTTDERTNSFLAAYDISDLGNIRLLAKIQSNPGSGSIVHNTHILGNYAITAWYKDGFTIVDVTRPDNLVQVGNYDTYPGGSGSGFDGCWGVYPYFPSGTIIASTITAPGAGNGELWILRPEYVRACYLEGKITNGLTGNPLNGVLIEVVGSRSATSLADGTFKMGQEQSGYYIVRLSKAGFLPEEYTVYFQRGDVRVLNTALYPTGGFQVDGLVINAADGAPVPGAVVSFSSWSGNWETTTAANGQFTIASIPAGMYDITAGAPGLGYTVRYKQKITQNKTYTLTITPKIKQASKQTAGLNPEHLAWPNPFGQDFHLWLAPETDAFTLIVTDQNGHVLEKQSGYNTGEPIRLGQSWRPGVYYLQLTSDNTGQQTLLIIKTRYRKSFIRVYQK